MTGAHEPVEGDQPLTWQRVLRITAGWVLVGLGVIGLFLPVLQGIALILLGALVLSRESARVRAVMKRLRQRHPKLDERLTRIQRRLRRRRRRSEESESSQPDEPLS